MVWRVINYQVAEPAWNMAVDEAMLCSYLEGKTPPTLRFYGWSPPAVSVGYFQDVKQELNLEILRQKGYGLVRRNTGGRTVLHEHELTYSVVAGVRDGVPGNLIDSYLYISKALAYALQSMGINAELNQGAVKNATTGACFESPSWYELTVKGRKLAGSAQFRQKDSFLQHGSILLKFSAADLGSVFKIANPLLPALVQNLQTKVTSLADFGADLDPTRLASRITESFKTLYEIKFQPGKLTKAETELAQWLVTNKYSSDQWNLQRGNTLNEMRLNSANNR